ncbi:TetR/AcrR family transcriptional regulator [Brachybacterium sp. FME24]|uniref:TetR/AcrR family transcriptional regulator n=1 Tax=Brachybacterium sp. FME24 TaxID=2742605 RepID=UPI001867286E|nr:TetR/AcrR family transcriptional regulator [Brachybacterium sp. FME24]
MPPPATSTQRRRRGAALVEAIHAAALDEAVEAGIDGMTMEGIATRARTAKTSLYRRWSTPAEILMDSLYVTFPVETPSPDADDLRGDLLRALKQHKEWLGTPMAPVVHAINISGARYADLKKVLYDRVLDARGSRVTLTVLRHYVAHGVIDADRVTPMVADIGEAMMAKILMDAGRAPSRRELEAIADEVILPAIGVSDS